MDQRFLTLEDVKLAFSLFCCVYGIGTLGMPTNYARAGPYLATSAIVFMAYANTYASLACSKVMLAAPRSVRTYGDLGEWCMGKSGRYAVVISQMANCLLLPCVFLILGGIILDDLFPKAFSSSVWIVIMALGILPVCLIPTLKEGAGAALAGCLGTILADLISLIVLLRGMDGHPSLPSPNLSFSQVAGTFGNLSLAYGAAIVIPALQRQHSDPKRMPRVVVLTMSIISVFFLCVASIGYSAVGCQMHTNLLFTILPDPVTGLTLLGFEPHKGAVILAYLFMQLHITIAFCVIIHPAFYLMERMFLGMHKRKPEQISSEYVEVRTPIGHLEAQAQEKPRHSSKHSIASFADLENAHEDEDAYAAELEEYKEPKTAIKYAALRITIIIALVIVAIVFEDHFREFTDVIGASAVCMSCIILPIVFYLKKCWKGVHIIEKILAIFVVIVCGFFGLYVTYTAGKELFSAHVSGPQFPYCAAEFQNDVYFNATAQNTLNL